MIHIVEQRKFWFGLSAALLLASVVFLLIGGLRLGTDFTGGTLLQVEFPNQQSPDRTKILEAIDSLEVGATTIQVVGEHGVILRLRELTPEEHEQVLLALQESFPGVEETSFSSVGPSIGRELRQKALVAILLVLLGIILYVSWAFRRSAGRLSGWAFGVVAILTLIHDVLITVGAFAILGYFAHVEVDVLFVTALLTVLGFSVHDTIVVFDRIREGFRRNPEASITTVINKSVNETLTRSINTSLTVLLALFSLYFFGGTSLRYFVLALIIGVIIGVYSSIFVASPLLLYWKRRA